MKKIIKLVMVLAISAITLSACRIMGGKTNDPNDVKSYETVHDMLLNLKTYKSEASVTYISNKGKNTYNTLQHSKITGEYRVEVVGPAEVAGNITLFDGNTIYQYNENISNRIAVGTTDTQERSEIFLTSFIRNYLNSPEVSVTVFNTTDNNTTVLEAKISGDHPYLYKEKLWVDNETFLPIQLVLYDADGMERIVIQYQSFDFNQELLEELFLAPQLN